MSDQADNLRQLVEARRVVTVSTAAVSLERAPASAKPEPTLSKIARSLLFTSGKGGVGTSNLVLNLAIALGELGQRVVVVDADTGLANLDVLCGLTPRFDLGDVMAGCCRLVDALVSGPGEIQIIPGAHAIRTPDNQLGEAPAKLVAELNELGAECDFILIDAGSGLGPGIRLLAAAVEQAVVVSTPEPTSIADAHAVIGRFGRLASAPRIRLLVNQAASSSEAVDTLDQLIASSRHFQGAVVSPLGTGWIRADSRVPLAVRARKPFLTAFPGSVAARGVRRLARTLVRERCPPERNRGGFLRALAACKVPLHVASGG
jgi:flagellar biosynthesis protein FlhG